MRQMSYSMCRFWAYDESKKMLGAGKDAPAWKLALAGSMGAFMSQSTSFSLKSQMGGQREESQGSLETREVRSSSSL